MGDGFIGDDVEVERKKKVGKESVDFVMNEEETLTNNSNIKHDRIVMRMKRIVNRNEWKCGNEPLGNEMDIERTVIDNLGHEQEIE